MPKDDPKTPSKSLSQDPLVERLISDPANPEPTVHLSGWLGKATQEGMWRLYLTPQLDEYVQFSESDVVHTQPLTPDQSPLGGSVVWLKAGTPLEHTHVAKTKMQADFLSGAVTSGYMAGAVPSFATSRQAKPIPTNTRGYQCSVNPHIPACQLRTEVCPIQSADIACGSGAFCPTREFVCGQTVGCTVGRECSVGC
jgi:hypothetical protein